MEANHEEKIKKIHFTDIETFPHLVCGDTLLPEKNWTIFKEDVTCDKCLEIIS